MYKNKPVKRANAMMIAPVTFRRDCKLRLLILSLKFRESASQSQASPKPSVLVTRNEVQPPVAAQLDPPSASTHSGSSSLKEAQERRSISNFFELSVLWAQTLASSEPTM